MRGGRAAAGKARAMVRPELGVQGGCQRARGEAASLEWAADGAQLGRVCWGWAVERGASRRSQIDSHRRRRGGSAAAP